MAISLKNEEAELLARRIAAATGESLTGVIVTSLRERLARLEHEQERSSLAEQLHAIARRAAALPELDRRSPEEIIGYDDTGVPR
jgi:antitoxin VapB